MTSPLKSLMTDGSRYVDCHHHFLENSNYEKCMKDFVDNQLPEILERTVAGMSHMKVIGVGSGSGELDLHMFSMLHRKYPHLTVDNEVVEPNLRQISDYRDLVSQTPGLDYSTFSWNQMTAEEFEEYWKKKKMTKKVDFIHMLQLLYYVKDPGATISFYQSLLNTNGKLLISLLSDESSVVKLWKTYKNQFDNITFLSTADIKILLDSKGVSYQTIKLSVEVDITDWYTDGGGEGELLLDFFTRVLHFSKTASPELKAEVIEFLRHPDWSVESNGKVLLTIDYEFLVVDQFSLI